MEYNISYNPLDPKTPLLLAHVKEKEKSNQTARLQFISGKRLISRGTRSQQYIPSCACSN